MAENDIIILDQILSQRKAVVDPVLDDSTFFEIFSVEELLKDYNLDYEEIENGIVGGSHDGGIDSFFIFIENNLVSTDFDYNRIKEGAQIEFVIIQSKTHQGYGETVMNNFISTFDDLLDMKKELKELVTVYNSRLLDKAEIIRKSVNELASKFPKIKFSFYYVTKGESNQVHKNVLRKVETLNNKIKNYFSNADFKFDFVGAEDLLKLSRKRKIKSLQLKISGNTISDGDGIICLVKLTEYIKFISDENNKRVQSIFDVNVREYEGAVEVNKAIRQTLGSKEKDINFWWLNNGITIVATKAPIISGNIILEDPKVVNGLQTSQEIAEYFRINNTYDDNRLVLVRIIVTQNENIRNQIIKATNNQTRIVSYSLRSTEKIHYDIEQYLSFNDIYYDRQKNFYKNQEKPRNKIVSMQFIAQCFAATILQEPNTARGRPGDLIKDDEKYSLIFNEKHNLEIYLRVILFIRRIDDYLKNEAPEDVRNERMNLRFHFASFITAILLIRHKIHIKNFLTKIDLIKLDKQFLDKWVKDFWKLFNITKSELQLDSNRVSRTKEFDSRITLNINKLSRKLSQQKK